MAFDLKSLSRQIVTRIYTRVNDACVMRLASASLPKSTNVLAETSVLWKMGDGAFRDEEVLGGGEGREELSLSVSEELRRKCASLNYVV